MNDRLSTAIAAVTEAVGDRAGEWDRAGRLPLEVLRSLGARGILCAEVPRKHGGLGLGGVESGELTAHTGSLCSSVRSAMTSQGIVAWTIQRSGDAKQREAFLPRLTGGELSAVAFSEPSAGSDLAAMETVIRRDGDTVVVDGRKVWVTGAAYADVIAVCGRYSTGAAIALVPASSPGLRVEPVPDPLGCRAAGHAHLRLDGVRIPASDLLKGAGQPLSLLVTSAMTYGRISVAWGCVGIVRACLAEAVRHAREREQFGAPIARHQLVARHLAEMAVAEQTATRLSEHASRCRDARSPEMVFASVIAKHVAAGNAAQAAASAVQVLSGAGAVDGHAVARAYRDAKVMEIIEGSTEICQLLIADHIVARHDQAADPAASKRPGGT